jgi:hypothetical protein
MPIDARQSFLRAGLLRQPVAPVGFHNHARRCQLAERGANVRVESVRAIDPIKLDRDRVISAIPET